MATYDEKTALLVVDVQHDFAHPKGSLYVKGGEEAVSFANEEIERALQAGAPVVYTQDWHPESTPHFQKDGGIWPVHCVQGTWGAEFLPDLKVAGEVVRKGTAGEDGYSGFSVRDPRTGARWDTQLEGILRNHGIEKVVIAGIATDYCVKESVLDARHRGFGVTVLTEGCRAVNLQPDDGEKALRAMEEAGAGLE